MHSSVVAKQAVAPEVVSIDGELLGALLGAEDIHDFAKAGHMHCLGCCQAG